MKFATSQHDRIALIKEIAERKAKLAAIKRKSASVIRQVRVTKASKPKTNLMAEDTSKNPNYWTDAPKYAKQYYGEVYHETTKYDNDWG